MKTYRIVMVRSGDEAVIPLRIRLSRRKGAEILREMGRLPRERGRLELREEGIDQAELFPSRDLPAPRGEVWEA